MPRSFRPAPPPALSPCIGVCKIDAASRLCTGCLRTLDEIAAWGGMSEAERRAVMADLPQRTPSGRHGAA